MEVQPVSETEYLSLREELLRRIDSRQQMLSVILGLGGAFLGLGWGAGSIVLFLYPIIALLLGAGWAQNEIRIGQLNSYLRDLESKLPGFGWQSYQRNRDSSSVLSRWSIEVLSLGAILIVTQWIAFGLGFYQFTVTPTVIIHYILMALDIVAMLALVALVAYVSARVTDR